MRQITETTPAVQQVTEEGLPLPGVYEIDPAHTNVTFSARHLMVSKVRGRFTGFSGTVHVADSVEDSRVEASIDVATIDTGMPMRDQHLRSPDFLDVERFPALTFTSTKVERTGKTTLRVSGDLTIRDVSLPVVLDAEFVGATTDTRGRGVTAFEASTEIDREAFGMTWNQALESGGVLVGRKVRIEIEVEAARAAKAEAA